MTLPFDAIPAPGTYPDFPAFDELGGRAIMLHLALAFRVLVRPADGEFFADEATLRASRSDVYDTNEDAAPALVQVGASRNIWAWFRFADVPETASVLRPDDVLPGDPGRWIRQVLPPVAACGTTRYYQHVELIDARTKTKDLWSACRGQTPALFVSFVGSDTDEASQTRAFYRVNAEYQIRVLSSNYRGGVAARYTPPTASEKAADPGVSRMIGDVRDYFIKDRTLSRTASVLTVKLGRHQTLDGLTRERVVCDGLTVNLIGAVYTPALSCEVQNPWRIWMQLQDALGRNAGPPNEVTGAAA